ncbi:calmodulin-binding protein 60 G isoform X2 [Neltuma alba]|uniref:calmodulin-binding protein 60 G isoform X2 n=1 Tax=Neltuma alba TaxID=207710 RepID=UPI0010A2F384|nr:calmodulin-binding protein 60 G-like isoform X2 [Prosopis alba]
MNMGLKNILLFLFLSFISASFEHLLSQPRSISNCKTTLNAFLNLLQVRQEVERKIQEYLFPRAATPCQDGTSGAKPLELRFINEPPETTFAYSNVIAEDEETPLKIALFDVRSQSVVSNGPLSSTKVEIFALDGDFCSKRCEDCTEEEFNANILSPREGKGSLLIGDRIITLKMGLVVSLNLSSLTTRAG